MAGEHQPAKIAALEGWWTTQAQQPTVLIGWPDEQAEINHLGARHSRVSVLPSTTPGRTKCCPGWTRSLPRIRPPVWLVFWAFRVMVGMGVLMVALGSDGRSACGWPGDWMGQGSIMRARAGGPIRVHRRSRRLDHRRGRAPAMMSSMACCGRPMQCRPWPPGQWRPRYWSSMIVYAIVFSAGALYILRIMGKGPDTDEPPPRTDEPPATPLGAGVREAS